jgi:hypothetical protein
MKYKESSKRIDLDCDLPTGAEDIVALRQARREQIHNLQSYFEFLAGFPASSTLVLGSRKGPCGIKPFELRKEVRSAGWERCKQPTLPLSSASAIRRRYLLAAKPRSSKMD